MADVLALAPRVLIINRGRLLYDGELRALVARIAETKRIELVLGDVVTRDELEAFGHLRSFRLPNATIEVRREVAPAVSAQLLARFPIADLSIQDPPLEEVIRSAFAGMPGAEELEAAPD